MRALSPKFRFGNLREAWGNLQNCLKRPPKEQFSAKLLEANLFPTPLQAPIRLDGLRNKIVQTNECDARDIVTTFCYEGSKDDWYVGALRALCEANQTASYFVRRTAKREHLLDRVENADRSQFGKVTSRTSLTEILQTCAYSASILADNHICVNTSSVSPDNASDTLMQWVCRRSQPVKMIPGTNMRYCGTVDVR